MDVFLSTRDQGTDIAEDTDKDSSLLNNQWDALAAIIENTCFKAIKYVKGEKNTAFESGSGGEWKENNI